MVGVARSGREPGACAGARQCDTRGGGRGAGSCLQPGQLSPEQHTVSEMRECFSLGPSGQNILRNYLSSNALIGVITCCTS